MIRPANDAPGDEPQGDEPPVDEPPGDEPPGDEPPGDGPPGHESWRDDPPGMVARGMSPLRIPLLQPSGQGRGSRFLAVDGSIPRPCAQKIITFDENVESRESM